MIAQVRRSASKQVRQSSDRPAFSRFFLRLLLIAALVTPMASASFDWLPSISARPSSSSERDHLPGLSSTGRLAANSRDRPGFASVVGSMLKSSASVRFLRPLVFGDRLAVDCQLWGWRHIDGCFGC